MPVEETVRAFDRSCATARCATSAASNVPPERLRESLGSSRREGLAPYMWLQPHYNLVEREGYERDYAPIVAEHGLSVAPYYALASGFLTGKYRDGGGGQPARGDAPAYLDERGQRVLDALDEVAARTTSQPPPWRSRGSRPSPASTPIASATLAEQLAQVLPGATST